MPGMKRLAGHRGEARASSARASSARAAALLRAVVCLAVLALLMEAPARAQVFGGQPRVGPPTDYVTWTATTEPAAVRPGEAARLVLHVAIDEGWKMYAPDSPPPSRGVVVTLDSLGGPLARRGGLRQSEPEEGFDPYFDETLRYYRDEATLSAVLAVAEEAETGTYPVRGAVEFMICNENFCLPPTPVSFSAEVHVRPDAPPSPVSAAGEARAGEARAPSSPARVGERGSEEAAFAPGAFDAAGVGGGWWGFVLLAAGAGLAALLTPCVFPMIPLTVSYFTRHAASRRASARMAVVYGGTIVLTFTGLGVLTALLVGAAGAQTIASNPWINLGIGLVFIVFALSLLGLFELRLPSGVVNYFDRQSAARGGYLGVFFMGLTLTLVSFSCTAPFVGGLLAATAGGTWGAPVAGMLVFSAVFSLPFMGFALFPRGLEALPRSGTWMNTLKVVLGFVELVAAFKFLSNADLVWGLGWLSRPLVIALSVVIFFVCGLYLLGKLRLRHEPPVRQIGSLRLLAAIAFFGLALYLLPGLLGAPLGALDAYLPPRQASDVSLLAAASGGARAPAEARYDWHTNDLDGAFSEAQATGQPVFIDFTGYTCTNCRAMEANVFPEPAVAQRFERDFVMLRLYTDDPEAGRALQRYQLELTGTTALPTYAVVSPQRELLAQMSGTAPPERFVRFLDAGHDRHVRRTSLASTR